MQIQIELITLAQSLPIREFVLRPGLPPKESIYPGEGNPGTFHLGALVGDEVVGTSSYYVEEHPAMKGVCQYRLRGMAILPEVRSMGLGSQLLKAAFPILKEKGCDLLWCNARVPAVEFYKRHGFEVVGEVFEIPKIGPHFLMFIRL